jgi:hypothetical protein
MLWIRSMITTIFPTLSLSNTPISLFFMSGQIESMILTSF